MECLGKATCVLFIEVSSFSGVLIKGFHCMCRHTAGGGGGTLSVPKTGEERGVMERERRELVREEESLKMAVQQMQRDVAQLRESITQLGKSGLENFFY